MAFYNQRWVQEALGVPVNFTITGYSIIDNMFYMTGDPMLPTIGNFDYLASSGVGLAFVYGDRDFQCNCKFLFCAKPPNYFLHFPSNIYIYIEREEKLTGAAVVTKNRVGCRKRLSFHRLPRGGGLPKRRIHTYRDQRKLPGWPRPSAQPRLLLTRLRGGPQRCGVPTRDSLPDLRAGHPRAGRRHG